MTDRALIWPAPKMQTFEQRLAQLTALSVDSYPYKPARTPWLAPRLRSVSEQLALLTAPSVDSFPYKRASVDVFTAEARKFWAQFEDES